MATTTTPKPAANPVETANLNAEIDVLRSQFTGSLPNTRKTASKPAAKPASASAKPAPSQTPAGPFNGAGKPYPPVKPVTGVAANGAKLDATKLYARMVAFAHLAISKLRDAENAANGTSYTGVHSVYGGFNLAFGAEFKLTKETVWSTVDFMVERGDLEKRRCKGGCILYIPGEMPGRASTGDRDASKLLALIKG